MACVYKITNKVNERAYVGYTKGTADERFNRHCVDAKRSNQPIHRSIAKYGRDNFTIEVLEESDDTHYLHSIREPYWISKFDNLYNIQRGGEGNTIIAPVVAHSIDGRVVEFESPTDVAIHFGVSVAKVSLALNRHKHNKSSGIKDATGFYWTLTRSVDDKGILHPRYSNMKKIVDQNGIMYENAFEAAREFEVSSARIRHAVKNGGKVKGTRLYYDI